MAKLFCSQPMGLEDTHIHMKSVPFSAMQTGVWKQANQQRREPRVHCVGADPGPSDFLTHQTAL